MLLLTSNHKEVLASCRIQVQATRKKAQEVAGLRTQKEVLVRALFLSCTVSQHLKGMSSIAVGLGSTKSNQYNSK